ncbi:MAG: hypothetical protein RBR59_04840 [Sulfurimonadaceae bacterium]|jgi:hypothetical protein|nr:hypothetical protein [Sulfurimonadaceae bacterium]
MEPLTSKKLSDPILLLKILDDGRFLVVDAKTNIRYLKRDTLEIEGGFRANIEHESFSHRVVSFSFDGAYFASLSTDKQEAKLFNATTKKFITKIDRHHGKISCVGIDPQGRYMFSCGEDGKTFVVDIKTKKLAYTLPIHRDSVEDIAFSPNSHYVATAGYDRYISLFNLVQITPKSELKAHSAPIVKLLFIGNKRLLSIDKKNIAIIWDIQKENVIARLEGIHDDVLSLTCHEEFLFLGTKLGYVMVYDLKTYKQITHKYIKITSAITALTFDPLDNFLLVATEEGIVFRYFIYEGQEEMQSILEKKKYLLVEKMIVQNPMLIYTKTFLLFNALWERTLEKGIIYLQNKDIKSALAIFERFQKIPSRNKIIQKVLSQYSEYSKFITFIEQKKIALAYSLALQYPLLQETPLYLGMEDGWKRDFVIAQKLSLDEKNKEHVDLILAPYRGIAKKTKLIKDLLTKSSVYLRFRVALGQQDFVVVFELIKQNNFLKEFPEYEQLSAYSDSLYIKADKLLKEENTHAAVKIFRTLRNFPDYEREAREKIKEIEAKQKFFTAIEEKDTVTAYNLLAEYEELLSTKDGLFLQERWNQDLAVANNYALLGDIDGVKKALENYISISSKYRSLAIVFGWCYMTQLENAMEKEKSKLEIEKGIKNYVLNFGLTDQILSLSEIFEANYPDSKLNFELLTKGSLSMWRPSMSVDSILE